MSNSIKRFIGGMPDVALTIVSPVIMLGLFFWAFWKAREHPS